MIPQRREVEPHLRKGLGQPPQSHHGMPPLITNCSYPRAAAACPPFPQTAPRSTNGADEAVKVREDTPWPSAGKMLRNLFEERKWVLPKDYLDIEGKKEDATVAKPPPKEAPKMGEQTSNQKEEKCGWDPIAPYVKPKRKMLIHPIYKNR